MKLLPRKVDIDKTQANERKREIDEGLSLARRVDALRETVATEEKNLMDYRSGAVKQVQNEIDTLVSQKDSLVTEVAQLHEVKAKLLTPLTKEWNEVNESKAVIEKEKQRIYLENERLVDEQRQIIETKNKANKLVTQTTKKLDETETNKQDSERILAMVHQEHQSIRREHDEQTSNYEKAMSDLQVKADSYQNGLNVIDKERKEIKEKESELIIREKHLEAQQAALRIAHEIIKNNG